MIKIVSVSIEDLVIVKEIAYKTWPICYADVITVEQMNYMLNQFYGLDSLSKSIENGHRFLLANDDNLILGFASYEHHCKGENKTRLHKIYMLPESQGKGIGQMLLNQVEDLAKENHSVAVSLNVNKYNKAQYFYKKIGFKIVADEVIDIGNNFIMDDFRMEKKL